MLEHGLPPSLNRNHNTYSTFPRHAFTWGVKTMAHGTKVQLCQSLVNVLSQASFLSKTERITSNELLACLWSGKILVWKPLGVQMFSIVLSLHLWRFFLKVSLLFWYSLNACIELNRVPINIITVGSVPVGQTFEARAELKVCLKMICSRFVLVRIELSYAFNFWQIPFVSWS